MNHVRYKGVQLPVGRSTFETNNTGRYLVPLYGPVEFNASDKYSLRTIRFKHLGHSVYVTQKADSYVLCIEDNWYIPLDGMIYCHISILLATYSKLGSAL